MTYGNVSTHQNHFLERQVDLSPKTRRGCLNRFYPARQPRTTQPRGLSYPHSRTSSPSTAKQSQPSPSKKTDKPPSATQNRQALSFDTNSRWVLFWTQHDVLHSRNRRLVLSAARASKGSISPIPLVVRTRHHCQQNKYPYQPHKIGTIYPGSDIRNPGINRTGTRPTRPSRNLTLDNEASLRLDSSTL